MISKLVTKIKNRPNFYYFDTALSRGKKTTVKYCLFTNDEYKACIIAHKIKRLANQTLAFKLSTINYTKTPTKDTKSFKQSIKNSIKSLETNDKIIKSKPLYLESSEYRKIFENVVSEFYLGYKKPSVVDSSQNFNIVQDKSHSDKLKIKFKEIALRYVDTECKKLRSSKNTMKYYVKTGEVLDAFFEGKDMMDISYKECEEFQTHLLNCKNLNKKTVNNYTCYATRLFDYAIKLELITQNPFKLLTPFKISQSERAPKDNFTMDEIKAILDMDRKDLRDYMIFALHTGLRLSEIWQLDESSIDIRDDIKFIKVQTAKQKGGAVKFREIPLHKNIEYLSDMKWLIDIKRGKNECDYFGKRLNRHIHKVVSNNNVSFHRLRGNFAKCIKDYCLENGIADVTSILLGHSVDLATDTYAKGVSLRAKAKAMEGLDILEFLRSCE